MRTSDYCTLDFYKPFKVDKAITNNKSSLVAETTKPKQHHTHMLIFICSQIIGDDFLHRPFVNTAHVMKLCSNK